MSSLLQVLCAQVSPRPSALAGVEVVMVFVDAGALGDGEAGRGLAAGDEFCVVAYPTIDGLETRAAPEGTGVVVEEGGLAFERGEDGGEGEDDVGLFAVKARDGAGDAVWVVVDRDVAGAWSARTVRGTEAVSARVVVG